MRLSGLRGTKLLVSAVLIATTAAVSGANSALGAPANPPITEPSHNPCPQDPGWQLSTDKPDPAYTRHAFIGNGYLAQRVPPTGMGYVATGEKSGFPLYTPRFDGAFVAGLYANAPTDQTPEWKHSYAAIPTWSTLTVGTGSDTYSPQTSPGQISNFRQTLNMRCGLLTTSLTWTAKDGKRTDLVYDVLADRADPHVGAVRVRITPHWDGRAEASDILDGAGARRMHPTTAGAAGDTVHVGFETDGVGTRGTVASTLRPGQGVDAKRAGQQANGLTAVQKLDFPVRNGQSYELTKYVGVDTSVSSPADEQSALRVSRQAASRGWDDLFAGHVAAWNRLWSSDIAVPGRLELQQALRSGNYGLLSSIRSGQNDSVAPAGLSSDNYAGLVFWDAEIWMYPGLLLQHPDIAKSIVDYREGTLPAAQANAKAIGQQGAFYPWESADTGNLNTDCHSWSPPHCLTQIHLQSDIALAAWQYYQATGDRGWLRDHGWSVLSNLAEFWAGRATRNPDGSYSINNVAGPDEYSNGVKDGVFTNAGAVTTLRNATEAARLVGRPAPPQWTEIANHLRIPFDPKQNVFQQYDGYQGGKIKQADTVLLEYPLEWPMSPAVATNTLDYYAQRTDPDGPAMTDAVHAVDAAANGEPGCSTNTYLDRSILPFVRDPFAQFSEARGQRAGEGAGAPTFNFLTGAGGFTQVFTHGLTGLRWRADKVHLDPLLPPQFPEGITLTGLHWQGRTFDLHLGPQASTVTLREGAPFAVEAPDGDHVASPGAPVVLKTRRPDLAPTDNLARCKPATASSEEPGKYAEAVVDGSAATTWVPDAANGALTVDLGAPQRISQITPQWTDVAPSGYRLLTSLDGVHFTEVPAQPPQPLLARYVRVELTSPNGPNHAGLRELTVTKG